VGGGWRGKIAGKGGLLGGKRKRPTESAGLHTILWGEGLGKEGTLQKGKDPPRKRGGGKKRIFREEPSFGCLGREKKKKKEAGLPPGEEKIPRGEAIPS